MGFADNYFARYNVHPSYFQVSPAENLGMIVVIPCYDDEHIFNTLLSLENCVVPSCAVEVIVVVNSSELTPQSIVLKNNSIYEVLKEKQTEGYYKNFSLLPILLENVPKKIAGVGNARKIGMDEAVRRFNSINKPNGVIISLDADTLVAKKYFIFIELSLKSNVIKRVNVIQFKHNFNCKICSSQELEACKLYEIYLRYFRLALSLTGFPYVFHTIGSCFTVDAETYTKVGGMPRKQGGEDFYFLHKAAQTANVNKINEILVYPSPRRSDRVPFGTGPTVDKIINEKKYLVYNFNLFFILKKFFEELKNYSNTQKIDINKIPQEIIDFIGKDNLIVILTECSNNSTTNKNLLKRIYSKFDAFFIIKFLNSFTENGNYPPTEVVESAKLLLDWYNIEYDESDIYEKLVELDISI